MKCLPSSKLPLAHGNVLHDWHAEILALRTFNRFLLNQCLFISTPPYPPSPYVRIRSHEERTESEYQPFTIREDVQIHMYCSEAPCGDASMELVMDAQDDATPWTSAPPAISCTALADDLAGLASSALRGRSHFGLLGAVRCKPSRPDAPPTLSKSCTDKLALTQSTSILSSLTTLLVSPSHAYLHSLTLPSTQFVTSACTRAFSRSGRMSGVSPVLESKWKGGYAWHGFEVRGTQSEFKWSRRGVAKGEKAVPSNLSAVWTPGWQETLIGGVLQGRKQFDQRGASAICRRSVWRAVAQVAAAVGVPALMEVLTKGSYAEVKKSEMLAARRQVKEDARKEGLKGWVKNVGDDEFALESE
ncbi:hypothetical protein BU26DRAFT_312032 [Trematosphaeria pertusa]|uniref:A to I editase domain-containing protein n=1 Tax=Trematosphaeria pertusa TaxID=390896 RepID=A0A6A6IGD6_9PLEO|nr:uncharacterized protein BU26DRAFT_312032 [Trematosphaeria pertusa]KAF2249098.1 hypothetical protein BU26DRAFT_312032 [Trematosphaeria pertusa]